MPTLLKTPHQRILTETARRMADLPNQEPPAWQSWNRYWWEMQLAEGPEFSTSWFGKKLTAAERRVYLRAIEDLDREGLLVRYNPFGRTTHVRLTGTGLKVAESLTPSCSR